jgi:serine/threonine protein kinase
MKSDELRNGVGDAISPAASAATALGPGPGSGRGTAVLPASASSERLAMGSGSPAESGGMNAEGERDEVGSGQIIDGRYRIIAKLGEGGMGEVYAAEHVHIEKRVAIKLLRHEILAHPEAVSRFRQEARSASSIGHENIIAIEDFGKLGDGRIYLCMELLDGKPLNDLLMQPMAPERVLNILIQTCHGLAAAHRKGIVHRDMKPENIFVTVMPSGAEVPKILDFGIAKVQGNDGGGNNNLTRTGTIFGTPYYMSPEQALGQRVDHRADIYAMGVIMYECFTGSIPFSGESFMGILTKHITADPTPPGQRAHENGRVLPAGIEPIILRAMKKNPEERQNTMDELVQELVAVHRNIVGPGMSSYMEAHQVSSAGFSALGPGHPGVSTPMSGMVPAYRPGSNTPLPPSALPTPTPFPGGATPGGGMVGYDDPRYGSQPLPSSSSLAMEPRRSSKVGLIAAIVTVLVVLGGTGGFLVYSGSLAAMLGQKDKPEPDDTGDKVDNGNGQAGNGQGQNGNQNQGQNGNQNQGQNGNQNQGQNGNQNQGQNGNQQAGNGTTQDGNTNQGTDGNEPDEPGTDRPRGMPSLVLLDSEPSSAVYEDDIYVGKTPLNIRVRASRSKTLVLKRKGYEDATIELDGSEAKHVVKLERKRSRNGGGRDNGDNTTTPPPEDDKTGDLGLGLE